MYPILTWGSSDQKDRWIPKLGKGEAIGCFGLTEPDFGSNPGAMRTRARRDGDGWILNGEKAWITNGDIADVAVVWARTDDGIRGFLVERGTPGFSTVEHKGKYSLRMSVTSQLVFEDCRLAKDSLLPETTGLKDPLSCLTQARYGITWGGIGAAQACLAEVLGYTESRELFGRPLNRNQAIQLRLADMGRRITAAQMLSLQLGRLKDAGQMHPTQVSVAKWNNIRMALDIARDCRDMLGGAGISVEYGAIRHMLNLESVITYEGTESVHQLVVGKELTGVNAF
jgi:glutaryl-CoA dehydrogenase